jgi:hypothetical protein
MGDFAQLNDNEAELLSGGGSKGPAKGKDSSGNKGKRGK